MVMKAEVLMTHCVQVANDPWVWRVGKVIYESGRQPLVSTLKRSLNNPAHLEPNKHKENRWEINFYLES